MVLKTTGISETAVERMNRLKGVDTTTVDQATSGVVDPQPENDNKSDVFICW